MTNKIMKKSIGLFLKLIILGLVIYLGFNIFQKAFDFGEEFAKGGDKNNQLVKNVTIKINKGSSTKDIAELLENEGLISSDIMFRINAKTEKKDGKFQYGTYELNTSMSDEEIMEILLTQGEQKKDIKFTIPEGFTIEQMGKKLEEDGICSSKDFMVAVNEVNYDYDFIKDIPERNIKLQGYLFPNTYLVREGASATEVVSKMLDEFGNIFTDEYKSRANQLGYNIDQIVTIASIIEREAKVAEERPLMASVIYNRLEIDMPLGMCSTVLYAIGKAGQPVRKLYTKETQVESPYNTYVITGLPLGPIANPGKAAIEAALYPDESKYLYFVLKDPQVGSHYFSKTLQEHNNAKNKYLK